MKWLLSKHSLRTELLTGDIWGPSGCECWVLWNVTLSSLPGCFGGTCYLPFMTSVLNTKAARRSETMLSIYQTARRQISGNRNIFTGPYYIWQTLFVTSHQYSYVRVGSMSTQQCYDRRADRKWQNIFVSCTVMTLHLLYQLIFSTPTIRVPPSIRVPLEKPLVSQLVKKFPEFLGINGSLQSSQQPATDPYPQLHESSNTVPSLWGRCQCYPPIYA
jgi:hypothetical protein